MIIYNPTDGLSLQGNVDYQPRHCFLMTRLGAPIHPEVQAVRECVTHLSDNLDYGVIDASARVTGRDLLIKIWKLIAATPVSIGVVHSEIPAKTQANIYYELGIAQALGKETLIIKCPSSEIPSDFVRTEYVSYDDNFDEQFNRYMEGLVDQAYSYETIADQLDRNPVLAIDYLKRAYLITGDENMKNKARQLLVEAGLENRAKNSVELLAASFAAE